MSAPDLDLCKIPAGPPPEGITSNFVNPPSLGPPVIAVMSITVAWGALFTAARLYLNFHRLRWTDYCVTIAVLLSMASLGIHSTVDIRMARHLWDIPACYFDVPFARLVYISALLLQLGLFFAKTSIFLLFLQLFTLQRPVEIAVWIGQVFNFLIYAAGIAVATYYQVPHIGERWENVLDGRSLIPIRWWQLQSALTVVLDVYIFVLPLPLLAPMRLPTGRKIALIGVFSLAALGIGASIASLVERIKINNSNDQTWIGVILSLCSAIELNIAIIVSSGPAAFNFARGHLGGMSAMIKSLMSIFSSTHATSRDKLYDPEAIPSDQHGDRNFDAKGPPQPPYRDPTVNRNHRYYELNDTWMLHSGASVDRTITNNKTVDGGIVRTVAFEQQEVTKERD